MSVPERELVPLYEPPRKGKILGYNFWAAHKVPRSLSSISSGGNKSDNIWSLSSNNNGVKSLSHWNNTTGEWIEYTNFCKSTKRSISFKSISAGANKELWGLDDENSFLYRRIPSYNEMKKGIYLAQWEKIETNGILFSTICVGSIDNIWAISYDPDIDNPRTVLYHLNIKLKSEKPLTKSTSIPDLLSDISETYEWNSIVVNKKLSKISCNKFGDIWAIDYNGKLYQRVTSKHNNMDPSFAHSYEPEEATGLTENFFLNPGEEVDVKFFFYFFYCFLFLF